MGDGVNIAVPFEGIAKPGAICLSEHTYWQVKGRLDLAVTDLGTDPAQEHCRADPGLFARSRQAYAGEAPSRPSARKSAPPGLSMVVLPFANIGGDQEQEHFVDGVTESLRPTCREYEAL